MVKSSEKQKTDLPFLDPMFSSSSNNGYNPFDPSMFTSQTTPTTGTTFYAPKENISSTPQDNLSPFLHDPAAFLDNGNDFLMSHLLSQHQEILGSCCNLSTNSGINNNTIVSRGKDTNKTASNNSDQKKEKKKISVGVADGDGANSKQAVPRKRAGKKDRHSKIYTAQGPRDRRMRLSLQIARKFFDLQDMLGFDKASKTIEWLFSKSRASIKDLKESMVASTGRSEQHKDAMEIDEDFKGFSQERAKIFESSCKAKESRDKARARARERTMKKMKAKSGLEMSKLCSDHQEMTSNDLDQLGSSSSKETCEDLGSCSQEMKTFINVVAEEEGEKEEEFRNIYMLQHQMDSVSIIEKFLGITSDASLSSIFGYSNNIGDSVGMNYEESYAYLSGDWNFSNHGVQSNYCALRGTVGSTGNLHVQNAVLATNSAGIDQNPNSFPMASSTIKKLNTASAFMNHSNNQERKP